MRRLRPFRSVAAAAAVAACLGGPAPAREVKTVLVGPGDDLQAALDAARPGDVVQLQAGATFLGNFILPAGKSGGDGGYITVRSSVPDAEGPAPSARVTAGDAGLMPKLRSPNADPALRTARGARGWRLVLLEFQGNAGGAGDIIRLGDGGASQAEPGSLAEDLVVDRCYIHGDEQAGQKRAIALNSGSTRIVNSLITDIKARGQDSQAIAGWNGPGPYTILNNRLEAAGEVILFGGADPRTPNLVPRDIYIKGNHLTRPEAWRGGPWQVKNLVELKNAREVRIDGNLLELNWRHAQAGYAVVLTPRNQDGGAPWATVEDVSVRFNVIRHVAAAFSVLGRDDSHESRTASRILIADNLLYDVDGGRWGGNGEFLLIGDGPSDVTVEHNTVWHSGNVISAYGGPRDRPTPIPRFAFRFNLLRHNAYGVHGNDRGVGSDTLESYFPGAVFAGNVLAGGQAPLYPPGNLFPAAAGFESLFVDAAGGDYRVAPGVDVPRDPTGYQAGADITEVNVAWRGAQEGRGVRLRRAPPPDRERNEAGRRPRR